MTTATGMMRAAIYTRVSHEHQVQEGFSLDAQLHRLNAFCTSQDWTVVNVYTDEGISAKNTERPALRRMLADIENGLIDVVLVYKLDRLTRSVLDLQVLLETFDKHSVGFKSSTESFDTTTANGRLFLTLVAAMASWEREILGERVKMGMAQRARGGQWTGSLPPVGYCVNDDGNLQIVPEEADVVRFIFESYIAGKSMHALAGILNESHSLSRKWNQPRIRYILSNPTYMGKVRWGEYARSKVQMEPVIVDGDHEPIISPELFHEAARIRETRNKLPMRSGTGHYPLTGLLRCGNCGGAVVGKGYTRKENGKMYRSYICKNRTDGLCDTRTGNVEYVEELFFDNLERIAREIESAPGTKKTHVNTKPMERELADIERKKKRWLDAFDDEKIDAQTMHERVTLLDARATELKARLLESQTDERSEKRKAALRIIQDIRILWDNASVEEQRELARSLVHGITITMHGKRNIDMQLNVRF